jgi:hypothetical protein
MDRHDITEILLKVALNTINLNPIHGLFSVKLIMIAQSFPALKYIYMKDETSQNIVGGFHFLPPSACLYHVRLDWSTS